MRFILRGLELTPEEGDLLLPVRVAEKLECRPEELGNVSIVRKAVDARRKPRIFLVYTVSFSPPECAHFLALLAKNPSLSQEETGMCDPFRKTASAERVVIAGMGPAGLFAAIRLAEYGIGGVLLERGRPVDERARDVQRFWKAGELDPESNVQFGEGGAGTFSDGKLTCRTRTQATPYVLEKFVSFGAPSEILYQSKPHIGTDMLREILKRMRSYLENSGFVIRFNSRMADIHASGGRVVSVVAAGDEILCDHLVLATGHSARDTYEMLEARGIPLERKAFAMGLRVEHPQELIDRIQYGRPAGIHLPAADYGLAWNCPDSGRSMYSFCMCPGGVVIGGSSEPGGVVTNGMSLHGRNSGWANSALVVNVRPEDFPGEGMLGGIELQRKWERIAFEAGGGGYRAPAQNMMRFVSRGAKGPFSSYRPGVVERNLKETLPGFVAKTISEGLRQFDRKMRGFVTVEATLVGIESRTSSPVRILRGENLESPGLAGLYPAGEGAGYSGGIMSSALDGIRIADRIAGKMMGNGGTGG